MMFFLYRAIIILLLLKSARTQSDSVLLPKRHDYKHTFKKPYTYNGTIPFFDTYGNTLLSEELIRLAPSVPHHSGSIWAQLPNDFKEWEVEISFRISGNYYVGGRGVAFWYTKERGQAGPVLGSKDQWHGLGIFFETADISRNRLHPVIMGHLNDGTTVYQNLTEPEKSSLAGCYRQFRNSPSPTFVKITHINNKIKVAVDANNHGQHYITCFESNDIKIPTGYFFGLSASAEGETPDDHDILSFELYEINPAEKKERPLRPHEKEKAKEQPADTYEIPEDVKKRIEEVSKVVNHPNEEHKKEEDTRSLDFVKGMQTQILETLEMLNDRIDHLGGTIKAGQGSGPNFPHSGDLPIKNEQLSIINQKLDRIMSGLGTLEGRIIHLGNIGGGGGGGGGDQLGQQFREELGRISHKLDALDSRVTGQHYQTQKTIMDATTNQQAVESKTSTWMWTMYLFLTSLVLGCGYVIYQTRVEINQKKFI
ncbi:hypothetical protein G9A89_019014 [Geosiphon pyriformis]|nr:hypothetical protein G9A89_019014 [Geosiphon pyriformis]